MYELVNTSLPNGLIAGTHGFATVAMTQGVSDALRGRLEALCSYAHRTSAHDATYYRQNPVNWFHVTLPQGEHAVGRVAPSDFDYTGRTNRLAKIRVFGANEMPDVGGAAVLIAGRRWFEQPWQGDPRYLAEDRNTCGRLRMMDPVQTSDAPAWESLFGRKGVRDAQRVAWQVERNLSEGGKAIYFKTSAAWDVSGEKLLGLFADVINLLPKEKRRLVTFSTYPVSLSGGTGCHLRGVYDRDRLFDVSSATQAWVDCENARIVHAETLPAFGLASEIGPGGKTGQRDAARADAGRLHKTAASGRGSCGVPATGGGSVSRRNLIAPQKKGPDMFVVSLVAAMAVVLLMAGGLFFGMIQHNKRQMEQSGAAKAVEEKETEERQDRLEQEKRDAERQKQEALERGAQEERVPKEEADCEAKATQEADEAKRRLEKEKADRDAKAEADLRAERARREAEERERRRTAFVTAQVEGKGVPPKPKTGLASAIAAPEMFSVFYYMDGGVTLTNEVAGFNQTPYPGLKSRIGDYALYVREPKCALTPLENSPVVLWLSKGRVWFDWSPSMAKRKRESWFAKSKSHDLQKDCFGSSKDVFDTWNKAFPVTYVVSWGDGKGQSAEWKSREFKLEDAVDVVYKEELKELKKAIEAAKKNIDGNETKIGSVKTEIAVLNDKVTRYNSATNRLHTLKGQQESLKKALKSLKGDKEKEQKEKIRRKGKEITEQEGVVDKIKIADIERNLEDKKNELASLEKSAKSLAEKHEEARQNYKKAQEDPDREGRVQGMSFCVAIKGVNE